MTLEVGKIYLGLWGTQVKYFGVISIELRQGGDSRIAYCVMDSPRWPRFSWRWHYIEKESGSGFVDRIVEAERYLENIAREKSKWRSVQEVEVRYR